MRFPSSFFIIIIKLNDIFFWQILLQDKYNIGVLAVDVDTCTKADFPYGLRLSWALPSSKGEEGNQPMTFVIHLKDNRKVRLQLRLSSLSRFWLSFVRPFGLIWSLLWYNLDRQ
jgi:hypothetical protein